MTEQTETHIPGQQKVSLDELVEEVLQLLSRAYDQGYKAGRTNALTEGYAMGYETAIEDSEQTGD